MTKTGTIGYIGSFPIPEVVSGINAYHARRPVGQPGHQDQGRLGELLVRPGKEADAAKALLDQGADVIAQHTDSPAPLQVAEARGKFGFGQASDMERFAPEGAADRDRRQLVALLHRPREGACSTAPGSPRTSGAASKADMVVMAPYTNMPDDVKKIAEETEAAIKSGKLNPFKCPVVRQDGKAVECKGGAALADGQILGMNFYVKGIDDKLPQ